MKKLGKTIVAAGVCAVLAVLIVLAASVAQASVLTAQEILSQFNGVISSSYTSTSEVEGRLAANNITGGATFYNDPDPLSAPSAFQAVNAQTIAATGNYNIDNGGSVNYIVSNAATYNFNNGGSLVYQSPDFAMSDFTTPLNALVSQLSSLSDNSTINTSDPNNYIFVVTPDASGTAVFSISTTTLQSANNISFADVTSAKTIIVNVSGLSFEQNFNDNTNNEYENYHVIWNFEDANSLTFNREFHGAVLGKDATVTNTNSIDGMLYAKNLDAHGELHDYPFQGSVVPIPPSAILLGSGLLGLGLLGYRRKRS